ncbi:unnamed protein product [Ophioblennius macclurei]
MPPPKAASNSSSVLIHPPGFYIIGFQAFSYVGVYIIFLALVYAATLVFNAFLMYIIACERCLHTPKFLAVFNLALVDILLSTTVIPSMVKVFFVRDTFISFDLCLVQMYFYYASASLEAYSLAVLAYDRLVAICLPLRQNVLNTLRVMSCLVALCWAYNLSRFVYTVFIITELSFCDSVRVFSYFCDYAPVFRLSCNDNSRQWSVASKSSLVNLLLPFFFILLSYASILAAVFRMKSVGSRVKALATCMEHLVLVAIFYVPLFTIFLIGLYFSGVDPDLRVLSLSMASCIPPCVNPIVYSLKTKEIRDRATTLFRRMKTGP